MDPQHSEGIIYQIFTLMAQLFAISCNNSIGIMAGVISYGVFLLLLGLRRSMDMLLRHSAVVPEFVGSPDINKVDPCGSPGDGHLTGFASIPPVGRLVAHPTLWADCLTDHLTSRSESLIAPLFHSLRVVRYCGVRSLVFVCESEPRQSGEMMAFLCPMTPHIRP